MPWSRARAAMALPTAVAAESVGAPRRARGRQRAPGGVVHQLNADVVQAAIHREARTLSGPRHVLAHATVPLEAGAAPIVFRVHACPGLQLLCLAGLA